MSNSQKFIFSKKSLIALAAMIATLFAVLVGLGSTNAFAASGDPVNPNPDYKTPAQVPGVNPTSGTAQRNSRGKVSVQTGKLILEDVPDFNFGITADKQGQVYGLPLFNNKADGSGENLLRVSDSRTPKGSDYQVTANSAAFKADNGAALPDGQWDINLNETNVRDNDDADAPVANPTQMISSGNPAQQGNDVPVLNAYSGEGYGTSEVNYNAYQDPDAATLDMPAKVNPATYHSTLTWTLNAAAPANANTPVKPQNK